MDLLFSHIQVEMRNEFLKNTKLDPRVLQKNFAVSP